MKFFFSECWIKIFLDWKFRSVLWILYTSHFHVYREVSSRIIFNQTVFDELKCWKQKSLPSTGFPLNKLDKCILIRAKLNSTFILLATITSSFSILGKYTLVCTWVVTFSVIIIIIIIIIINYFYALTKLLT